MVTWPKRMTPSDELVVNGAANLTTMPSSFGSTSSLMSLRRMQPIRPASTPQLPPQERAALLDGRWDVVDVPGAIYREQMQDAHASGRVRRVPVQIESPVHTAWDIGVGDSTAIWLWQRIGAEVHVVGFLEDSGNGIPHYAQTLKAWALKHRAAFGTHYGPHDLAQREFSTGMGRLDTAREHGLEFVVLPRADLEDGIHTARMLFPRCYFDAEACEAGLEALMHYRRDYNQRLGEFKATPVHDWSSHGADAFRYLAQAYNRAAPKSREPIKYPKLGIV